LAANALVITLRTAGNYVSNILNKPATVNRTEAASYAHTHGLEGPTSEVGG